MDKFYRHPFLFITPCLIAGIVLGTFGGVYSVLLTLSILVALTLAMYRPLVLPKSALNFSVVLITFLFLGILLAYITEVTTKPWFPTEENGYVVEVLETGAEDKLWKKGIVNVNGIIDSSCVVPTRERILVYYQDSLVTGDQLLLYTKLIPIENKNNPGEFDAQYYWKSKGIEYMAFVGSNEHLLIQSGTPGVVNAGLSAMRSYFSGLMDRYLPAEVVGLGKAIILGDKSDLSAETRASFSKAGAMHVLAVSGLHVGIIMMILLAIFGKFSAVISSKSAFVIVLVLTWVYAGITGFSPSVLRAVIMFSIVIGAKFSGNRQGGLNGLFLSAFILLLWDPKVMYDIGFQLSYAAMLGILVLYKPVSGIFKIRQKLVRKVWEGTAVGIAAQFTTFPLTLYYFNQFPNYFMISNLGVMLLSGVILGLGIGLMALGWNAFSGAIVAFFLGISLLALAQFMLIIEDLPFAVAYGFNLDLSLFLAIVLFVMLTLIYHQKQRLKWVFGLSAVLILLLLQVQRNDHMTSHKMLVFNSKFPVLCIKEGKEILCVYSGGEEAEEQARRLMEDFQKVAPGKVRYVESTNKELTVQGEGKLSIRDRGDCIELIGDHVDYLLRKSYRAPETSAQIIDMPYLAKNQNHLNLSEGAIVLSAK